MGVESLLRSFSRCVFGDSHRFSTFIFSNRSSNMCNVADDFTNGYYVVHCDNLYDFHFVCSFGSVPSGSIQPKWEDETTTAMGIRSTALVLSIIIFYDRTQMMN